MPLQGETATAGETVIARTATAAVLRQTATVGAGLLLWTATGAAETAPEEVGEDEWEATVWRTSAAAEVTSTRETTSAKEAAQSGTEATIGTTMARGVPEAPAAQARGASTEAIITAEVLIPSEVGVLIIEGAARAANTRSRVVSSAIRGGVA